MNCMLQRGRNHFVSGFTLLFGIDSHAVHGNPVSDALHPKVHLLLLLVNVYNLFVAFYFPEGQFYSKQRAIARSAFHLNNAVMFFYDAIADGQPESGSFDLRLG